MRMGRLGWVIALFALPMLLAAPAAALNVAVTWTNQEPPSVTTLSATELSESGARLHGDLLDLGGSASVTVSFEWGTTPALGQETGSQQLAAPGAFEATLTELEADQNYYFRAKASGNGTAVGQTQSFRTAPAAPVEVLPIPWLYVIIAVSAAVVSLLLLRKRLPFFGVGGAGDAEGRSDDTVQAVDETLTEIQSLKPEEVTQEKEEKLTAALVASVAPAEGRDTRVFPREIDPVEAKRRQAIFQQRIRTMDQRLAADVGDLDAVFAKATFLVLQTEHQEALRLLDDLTRQDPKYPGAWHLKAKVYRLLGDEKMAELCLQSADRFA